MIGKRKLLWMVITCGLTLAVPFLASARSSPGLAPEVTPTPEPGVFRAYRALRAPTIDGSLGDWPVQGGIILTPDTASYVTGSFSDDRDGSATCRGLWNDSALYVGCEVSDDVLIADSGAEVWKDDLVELAFDGKNDDNSFCGDVFCPDDHKYELRVDGTVTDDAQTPDPPVAGAVASRAGGYSVEIAIPVANFAAGAFAAGKTLGFNLGLIDDDTGGGTDGHLYWMGRNTWAHAEEYGDLVLDPQSFAPPNSTATPTPTRTSTPTPTTTHAPLLDLTQATPVACGENHTGDTYGASAHVNSYGCVPYWPEQGPEQVYSLSLTSITDLDAMLVDLSTDLDLFLLTGASPATCIGYGDSSVSASALAPGTYYLVVDGYDGAAGTYGLQVWCPLEPPLGPSPTPTATPTATVNAPHLYFPLLLRGS